MESEAKEENPLDSKDVSPNASELGSASLR